MIEALAGPDSTDIDTPTDDEKNQMNVYRATGSLIFSDGFESGDASAWFVP